MKRVVIDGLRYYAAPGGLVVPSVTTVLNQTANRKALELWEKKIGKDEADRRRKIAQDRGNRVHENLEAAAQEAYSRSQGARTVNFPLPHPEERYWGDGVLTYMRSFGYTSSPFVEYRVYHPLGFAGTGDLFFEDKKGWHYLDAKTADKRKDPNRPWVVDHFLQAAAYVAAFYKQTKKRCVDTRILVCLPDNEYQVLKRDAEDLLADWNEFKLRLDQFNDHRMQFKWSMNGRMW